ncbi:MAG: TIGR01212 family radical SAM protein [Prevotella sp.]
MNYLDYGTWLRRRFPFKVQKISIDAGFTCPNRDGTLGKGGCIYCNNKSFSPTYCDSHHTVRQQLEEGKRFFSRKYNGMKYMAYFQSFTNTYADMDRLRSLYEEALEVEDIVGIIIGTRPDCISTTLLDYLEKLNRRTMVTVEYGIETANDETLRLINRGHDFNCSRRAVELTAERGITVGGHVIIGLPGESAEESIRQARIMSELRLDILKIHQMQIIKGTQLEKMYEQKPFHLYSPDEYIEVIISYLEHLRGDIAVERFASQSPKELLVAPQWGLKNYELTNLVVNKMKREGRHQGSLSIERS